MVTQWRVLPAGLAELHLANRPGWRCITATRKMPQLGPYVSDAQTWSVRRAMSEEVLAKPDTLLLMDP